MKDRFETFSLPLKGLFRIVKKPITDSRGCFTRLFCAEEFQRVGFSKPVAQINYSSTQKKGTIRGMHFQHPPFDEEKIVNCIRGEVLDVAIDIRKDSPTFLHWHGELLSERNQTSLFIPKGFAHGFQTLVEDCQLLYMHSEYYVPDSEGALNALDSRLAINWPIKAVEMSERDRKHPWLSDTFCGIEGT